MRRIKTPLRRRGIILAETKGLADADLATSPAVTCVIPPFCGGFLDCRIENPPRLRGNRNDLTAHSLSNLLVVEPAITDCKTFVHAFVPTGYNKNAHFGRFYYNWRSMILSRTTIYKFQFYREFTGIFYFVCVVRQIDALHRMPSQGLH